MGMDLGMVIREETACTMKDKVMPMGMRRSAFRPAAGRFSWMPSAKGLCQSNGKMNQEMARVAM